jgi:hypothetical protein
MAAWRRDRFTKDKTQRADSSIAKGRPWGARNKPFPAPPPQVIRRFHDIMAGIIGDLGGYAQLSTGEKQLARRGAYISMHCELMEQHPAPSTADLAVYGTLTSHLVKTLRTIGLKRLPKDVTPTLRDYLDARAQTVTNELEDDPEAEPSAKGVKTP